MRKHTPGPWQEDRNEYDVEHDEHTGWIAGRNGEIVCEYAGCGTHFANWPNPADFALAKAAPDLLEALTGLLREAEAFAIAIRPYAASENIAAAKAAIAKATGEDRE